MLKENKQYYNSEREIAPNTTSTGKKDSLNERKKKKEKRSHFGTENIVTAKDFLL